MRKKEINASKKGIFKILIAVFIVAALVLMLSLLIWSCSVRNNDNWRFCADYEQYSDDFNLVRRYITTEFSDKSDELILVTVGYNSGKITLYDTNAQKYLSIPDDVFSSLDVIVKNGFSDSYATWAYIEFYNGNVLFGIENGHYQLVYSPERDAAWVNLFYSNKSVNVKEIADDWHHVVSAN